jgi:Carboxypeptidase regulatory-like domain
MVVLTTTKSHRSTSNGQQDRGRPGDLRAKSMTTLLLLSVALLAVGLAQAPQPSTIAAGDATISGRVTDRTTDAPLSRALVTLTSLETKATLVAETDETGRYAFERIVASEYRVSARHDLYVAEIFDDPSGRPTAFVFEGAIRLSPGQRRTDVNFSLHRGGSLRGRVAGDDGQPLKGANVTALRVPGEARMSSTSMIGAARTNDRGEYVLANLADGEYHVSAMWSGTDLKPGTPTNLRQTYFPGTANLREASPVKVRMGEVTPDIDIVIPVAEMLRIEGQIVRSYDGGRVDAYLLASGAQVYSVPVAEDGTFSTPRLRSGRYTLVARAKNDDAIEATTLTVDLTTEMTDVVLPLMSTGSISGRVVLDDGSTPTNSFQVAAVLAMDGKEIDPLRRDRVDIGPRGTFTLTGLFGERLLRIIGLWDGRSIDRVLVGKTAVTSIAVQPGLSIDDVVVVLTRQ